MAQAISLAWIAPLLVFQLGALLLGERVQPTTSMGAAIIVGACFYAARRRAIADDPVEQAT